MDRTEISDLFSFFERTHRTGVLSFFCIFGCRKHLSGHVSGQLLFSLKTGCSFCGALSICAGVTPVWRLCVFFRFFVANTAKTLFCAGMLCREPVCFFCRWYAGNGDVMLLLSVIRMCQMTVNRVIDMSFDMSMTCN